MLHQHGLQQLTAHLTCAAQGTVNLAGRMASPDPLRLAASMRAHRQALRGARGCHCCQGIGGCPWQRAGARGGNSATACRHPIASCSCHRFALNLNCTHGYWESSLLRAASGSNKCIPHPHSHLRVHARRWDGAATCIACTHSYTSCSERLDGTDGATSKPNPDSRNIQQLLTA